MKSINKRFGGEYHIDGKVIPNLVSSFFEGEILNAMFKGLRTVSSITIKCGQIAQAFDKDTVLTDITEAENYTPVTLDCPDESSWVMEPSALAASIITKDLNFLTSGDCVFNCMYMVDQDNNLLSVSARYPSLITKSSNFTAHYRIYAL